MSSWKIFGGVLRYEFLMQIRRPALWLAFLLFALISARSAFSQIAYYATSSNHFSILQQAAFLAVITNWLAPLGVGILIADRVPRDRRTRVEEVFTSLPSTLKIRILGKYVGTLLASLIPSFLLYAIMTALAVWRLGQPELIPAALLCYVLVILPGMCFVAAFSLALPVVIWVPLYQFLFFGYWFWGNIFSPAYGIPTLSGTILTPIGSAIGSGLFGVPTFGGQGQYATTFSGISSLMALLGIAVLVLVALYQFLKFEQIRQ